MRIAVIDDFTRKDVNIGTKKDFTHGELVAKYASAGIEDKVDVVAFDVVGTYAHDIQIISPDKVIGALEEITRMKNVDAVNMSVNSCGEFFGYDKLSKRVGKQITPDNVVENKQFILDKLKSTADEFESETYVAMQRAKNLSEVFMSAGNQGADTFNQWHFTDGVHIVGATDEDSVLADYSSENPFVTNYAQGTYHFKPVYDKTGGYKGITDGKIFFDAEEAGEWDFEQNDYSKPVLNELDVMAWLNKDKKAAAGCELIGTSFAAPTRVNQHLKGIPNLDLVIRPNLPVKKHVKDAAELYLEAISGAKASGYLHKVRDQKGALLKFLRKYGMYTPKEFIDAENILKSEGIVKERKVDLRKN